ncbi:MAG TPA: AlpA family phage regulatory protein [Xanthomonadaceae bacterium]|nr:AlpA family phage regulatory protein [Xanthomonadaceae bacterium]
MTADTIPTADRLLRRHEVERMTGLRRSSLYRAIAAGTFPRPAPLSEATVAWSEREVAQWIAERIAERDRRLAERGAA